MNKKTTYALLLMGGVLTLSSCSKEDSDVYVGVDAVTEVRQQLKARLEELPEIKTGLQPGDSLYQNQDPEVYTDKVYTDNRNGYYGYVDLGLSVKWCSSNIDSPSQYNENVSFDAIYADVKERMNLTTPVVKPEIEVKNGELPAIMSYDEYKKYMDVATLRQQVDKYSDYCNKMQRAYEGALEQYKTQQIDHHNYQYQTGSRICWGCLSDGYYRPNSGKDSPENIGGNVDYDICTKKLGDGWRLPTRAEWQELIEKCKWEEKDKYWLVTGPNGNNIVLPNSFTYSTSERTDEIAKSDLCYVYVFNPATRSIEKSDGYRTLLPRAVYTK